MTGTVREVWGGVEGGGTKFNCILGTGPDDVLDTLTLPTTSPQETLTKVIRFFQRPSLKGRLKGLGFASFGPIDLNPGSSTYGYITTTPKPDWPYTDVVGTLRAALGVPIGWDTDVNGAGLGETHWGAAQGCQSMVYITVGTGIGGGGVINGAPLHGLLHPEMGHLLVRRVPGDDFAGICPYHGDCWEGLICGPALKARLGQPAQNVAADHPIWKLVAHYLALGIKSIVDIVSPERIVVGGGVMNQQHMYPLVRHYLKELHNGYLQVPAILDEPDTYIVPPALGGRAGMLGALELARLACERETP